LRAAYDEPICCADRGEDTIMIGEWYMVHEEIWERAWSNIDPRARWHQILCIGCLERCIGRTLMASDFPAGIMCNDPKRRHISDRMRDRLTATVSRRRRGRAGPARNALTFEAVA
jgi:hypothetical protein